MSFCLQQKVLTNEISLAYREQGTGEAVVMLHGLADHGLVWQSLAAHLSDRYRCLAPDLRGHGNSSKPPESAYDSQVLAADLEGWAEALGLDTVRVIAHSWAAKIALLWAQQQPHRLRSLILVDPFFVNRLPGWFRPTFPILYRTLPFLKVMGPFANEDAAVAVAQGLKQYRGWSPLQQAVFQEGMEQRADGSWGSKFAIAARNGVFDDVLQRAGLAQTVATPTGLLLPEKGLNRTRFQIKPYQQYLPQLSIQHLPGNHWPHLVEPDAFNQAVAAFLATLP
ncbi:MAG: alpha/beta hydrolase [Cyanobacteria bacterium J06626_4]